MIFRRTLSEVLTGTDATKAQGVEEGHRALSVLPLYRDTLGEGSIARLRYGGEGVEHSGPGYSVEPSVPAAGCLQQGVHQACADALPLTGRTDLHLVDKQ